MKVLCLIQHIRSTLRRFEMVSISIDVDGSLKTGNEKQIGLCFKTIIMSLLPYDITT